MKAKLAAAMAAAFILLAGSGWHAAAQNAAQSQPIRRGGDQQATKIVKMVRPAYPKHLKEAGVEGKVKLDVVITREGKIARIEASTDNQAHQDFVQASIDAVKQWEYEPTLLNGEPVDVITSIDINFTLTK